MSQLYSSPGLLNCVQFSQLDILFLLLCELKHSVRAGGGEPPRTIKSTLLTTLHCVQFHSVCLFVFLTTCKSCQRTLLSWGDRACDVTMYYQFYVLCSPQDIVLGLMVLSVDGGRGVAKRTDPRGGLPRLSHLLAL